MEVPSFVLPEIKQTDFSEAEQFPISNFGAEPLDIEKTNSAIKKAINAAEKKGKGIVVVPEGEWHCASIHLKSNVNLHLVEGATLIFSSSPSDYLPAVKTSWEGMECMNYSPLVYAYECENVAVTGKGKLKAKLDVWKQWYERPKEHIEAIENLYKLSAEGIPVEKRNMTYAGANLRPHFIQFNRCRQILVEDIEIEDSPFWVIHPYLCKDVIIRGVQVKAHGHNNDGVDPEMTQNMLIENCVFNQGDDAISIKSGRECDAWLLSTPSKNITIRNCVIQQAHHLLAIGSELSGGVENIFLENCRLNSGGEANLNINYLPEESESESFGHLLYIKTNAYRGGYVRNVQVKNCTANKIGGAVIAIETDVLYQWRSLMKNYDEKFTSIDNIKMHNIQLNEANNISLIKGDKQAPVSNIRLNNIHIEKLISTKTDNQNVIGFSITS